MQQEEEFPRMAGLGAAADGGEQPFMVSSLPLVFCDGHPVAIENMPDVSTHSSLSHRKPGTNLWKNGVLFLFFEVFEVEHFQCCGSNVYKRGTFMTMWLCKPIILL